MLSEVEKALTDPIRRARIDAGYIELLKKEIEIANRIIEDLEQRGR